jgi:hypothetical protein
VLYFEDKKYRRCEMMTVVIDHLAVEMYFHHSEKEVTDFLEVALREKDPSITTSEDEVIRRVELARKSEEWIGHEEFWQLKENQ